MKPQLVSSETLEALKDEAGETLDKAVTAARGVKVKDHARTADRLLFAAGSEISTLLIILLALAILCAPIGLGLAAVYFLSDWVLRASGSTALGWIVAVATFAFLCRYIWGARLQRATRQAALALIGAMAK